MLCSTLSRFQGGIWGLLIPQHLSQLPEERNLVNFLAILQAKTLIESGNLDSIESKVTKNLTTSQLALANLPLILLFHDSPQLLKEKLTETVDKLNKPTETLKELLIWGKAIALGMRGKLEPQQLSEALLQENSQTILEQQIELIASYLKQDYSLTQVIYQLSRRRQPEQTPIALALYCFLFTPTDLASGITRAYYGGYQAEITSALTGVLGGVYNGYQSVPLKLRLGTSPSIANQLYTAWCGATPIVSGILLTQAIAISGSLQKRSQLQIISQVDSP
ncbi:ADP-ribosylglycohydrolase family protein [Gloeocapsa sp. PCC 73106]|uniref:ADP-ribosylglycohydrolase family protein n=1 Tax=Gloeocapsa sp. PCC 73106 TaxID=102232 RepID=UPI0002AC4843|nr:ADP-ribosylglycohydrolase family protein [Gloeocapsa sp. PCC 73106]ELR98920.1 ADP-ribosylglycohydrolase [Gloeocapsa sp. PCC 73106]